MLADLKRSGLTEGDAKKLGYKVLTPKQTRVRTDDIDNSVASYLIPYYTIDGKKTDFWRVRFLEDITGPFGTIKAKPRRYSQAKDTLPRFYFPKGGVTLDGQAFAWHDIANNPNVALIITEGEKKAAKACREGLVCISVGGVWAWRSKNKGKASIPDFDLIKWTEREVFLCFDNDVVVKPSVIGALNALAGELTRRGAKVFFTYLPKGPGTIKLDDYLVKRSAKSFLKLENEPYEESGELWKLNDRLAFVGAVGRVWDFKFSRFHKSRHDLLDQFANLNYPVPKADGKGFTVRNAAKEWLAWPQRREYDNIVYAPGESTVVGNDVNVWPGWGVEPTPGDVAPFYALIDFLFADDLDSKAWFLQWLAYPIQHPGAKLYQAALLHSRNQGVGKSLLGEIIGDCYGTNFNLVSQDELHSPFNGWLVHRQFILGEELTGSNTRKDADAIKNMITRAQVTVNIKMQPTYEIVDCVNYLLTSNRVDALFLDDEDRRAFVYEITAKAKPDSFYKRISNWRRNDGPSHLLYHLMHEFEITDYEPTTRARMTEARQNMINLSKSDLDIFAAELKANPDDVLRFKGISAPGEIFTIDNILSFANDRTTQPPTRIALAKALRRVGFFNRTIRVPEIGIKRLWPLRNLDKWKREQNANWGAEFANNQRKAKYR